MLLDTTLDTVETPDVLTSLHQIATNKLVMKIILLAVKFGSNFLAKKKKKIICRPCNFQRLMDGSHKICSLISLW